VDTRLVKAVVRERGGEPADGDKRLILRADVGWCCWRGCGLLFVISEITVVMMFLMKRKSRRESGRLRYMEKIRSRGILVIDAGISMEGGACGPPSKSNDLLRTQIR
jgi:hypothetical protein